MIESLPSGWLVNAPGSGRVMLAVAVVVFVVAAGWSARSLGRRAAPVIGGGLIMGALGAWLADTIMTGVAVPVGLSLFGAALGGPLGAALCARWLRIAVAPALDALALPALLSAAIARVGCLLAGCDVGGLTDHAFSVRYASGTAPFVALVRRGELGAGASMTPPLQPFALYEVMGVLVALVVVAVLTSKRAPPKSGVRALAAGAGYFVARALAEPHRAGGGGPALTVVSSIIAASLFTAALVSWRSTCLGRSSAPSPRAAHSPLPSSR